MTVTVVVTVEPLLAVIVSVADPTPIGITVNVAPLLVIVALAESDPLPFVAFAVVESVTTFGLLLVTVTVSFGSAAYVTSSD